MAKVRISDVVVPEVFNPYVLEQSVKLDTLIASGIVSNGIGGLDLSGGGFLFKMPFWLNLRNSGMTGSASEQPARATGLSTSTRKPAISQIFDIFDCNFGIFRRFFRVYPARNTFL